jgi:hypothetical protein
MGNIRETNELQDVDLSPLRALRREALATRMAKVRKARWTMRFTSTGIAWARQGKTARNRLTSPMEPDTVMAVR